jgi:acyl carrier protein
VSPNHTPAPDDDPALRDTLKRCSPATYYAACKFRASGDVEQLRTVVLGVVERFVERELREKLHGAMPDVLALRLREDLGLDSLTMMEVVMIAEEVLPITISNEELTRLRTVGAVQAFLIEKVQSTTAATDAAPRADGTLQNWDLAAVGEQVRQIEARNPAPLNPLADHRPNHA